MVTRIVFREETFEEMSNLLFDKDGREGAAFVLCGRHKSHDSTKLLAREVIPLREEDYEYRGVAGLTIASPILVRVAKRARSQGASICFVHSHPDGHPEFSSQDDREEPALIDFFQRRVPDVVHATMVVTRDSIRGRLFDPNQMEVDLVMSIGSKFRIWSAGSDANTPKYFDRQVLAFGKALQDTLGHLHVGIVGLGGTGSPLAEQLYRLGIGHLSMIDHDHLEETNLNRVYGARLRDVGTNKATISERHLKAVGLPSRTESIPESIALEEPAKLLADCDLVFGCTDKETPRAILNFLSLRYLIPVFDLGVLIDSTEGVIDSVVGRVTTLLPGEACLFCRERISVEGIRAEGLSDEERANQIAEGYAPELPNRAPAVIPFTSSVASTAVMELLHRLTGFMGSKRLSTEVLTLFHSSTVRTNRVQPRSTCVCQEKSLWGIGEEDPFLGMVWPSRTK